MQDEVKKFGQLKLTAKGTNNGRGFDILYGFKDTHDFVEFVAKKEFYFIQPWMQFPSSHYTDECMLVSIELVHRFNEFENMQNRVKQLEAANEGLSDSLVKEQARFGHLVKNPSRIDPIHYDSVTALRKAIDEDMKEIAHEQ